MNIFIKFLVAAVAAGTPLLFGTVGEILSEKTGHPCRQPDSGDEAVFI